MYQQRESCSSDDRQGRPQLMFGNHCEAVDSGIHQEAFEAGHTGRGKFFEVS